MKVAVDEYDVESGDNGGAGYSDERERRLKIALGEHISPSNPSSLSLFPHLASDVLTYLFYQCSIYRQGNGRWHTLSAPLSL